MKVLKGSMNALAKNSSARGDAHYEQACSNTSLSGKTQFTFFICDRLSTARRQMNESFEGIHDRYCALLIVYGRDAHVSLFENWSVRKD